MNTRSSDLASLRKIKNKLEQIESSSKSIAAKEKYLEHLKAERITPKNYQELPTDKEKSTKDKLIKKCSSQGKKLALLVFILLLLLNICIFVFTIVWLNNAPETAWITQADEGESLGFWIGHCISGLFVALLPAIIWFVRKMD